MPEARRQPAIVAMLLSLAFLLPGARASLGQAVSTAATRPVVLLDFDRTGLWRDWRVSGAGKAELRWEKPPVVPADATVSAGDALHITAEPRALVYAAVPFERLAACERLSFWVYVARRPTEASRPPATAPKNALVMDLQLREEDGRAGFWRRVELKSGGWSRVEVPLRYMRRSEGRSPQWDRVRSLAFAFREAAEVWVDNVSLAWSPGRSAELADDELVQLAFPGAAAGEVRTFSTPRLLIMTDAPELELPRLGRRLEELLNRLAKDLPFAAASQGRPILIVFRDEPAFAAFPPRLAALLNASSPRPSSGGYTLHGIATSYWHAALGTLRPVYVHEFVHSWLDRVACLSGGSGDWLQEGLASYYQLELQPQENFRQLVAEGLADEAKRLPLQELCAGRSVPLNRYWQALTVVQMLLTEPKYRAELPKLWEAMREKGSTNLEPFMQPILHSSWHDLTDDWLAFCRRAYPADGGRR